MIFYRYKNNLCKLHVLHQKFSRHFPKIFNTTEKVKKLRFKYKDFPN